MEDNKELVEETTENVEEQPTEEVAQTDETVQTNEPEKIYSEEDLNRRIDELLPKKLNRREEKIRREYESKYGRIEGMLKAGLRVDDIDEAADKIEEMYKKRGINLPSGNDSLTSHQAELLASAEARELIEDGTLEEIDEEMRTLADKGYDNMTSSEKIKFTKLNAYVTAERDKKELAKAGISPEDVSSSDYIDFASKLDPNLSTVEKYEIYKKYKPGKPQAEPMGSMKGTAGTESVKDFYTYEEAAQFTKQDFDKNPALFEAVERSMLKWK